MRAWREKGGSDREQFVMWKGQPMVHAQLRDTLAMAVLASLPGTRTVIFFFFQGDLNTKQKKKIVQNHHIVELDA